MAGPAASAAAETARKAGSMISPLEIIDRMLATLAVDAPAALLAIPAALADAGALLLKRSGADLDTLLQALAVALAILGTHALVRRLTAGRRRAAIRHPLPFLALLQQAGWEMLALAAAGLAGRMVVLRWLDLTLAAPALPAELAVALVRLLFGLTLLRFFFQPAAPMLRLVQADNAGAGAAVRWAQGLFVFGHAHALLLGLGARHGLAPASQRALTILAALIMLAGAVQVFRLLRRHGLGPWAAQGGMAVAALMAGFWIWGAISGETNLFRGALGSLSIVVLAFALDRVLRLSIRASRRPEEMRRLFVLRVVADAVAVALILRVLMDFWFSTWPGLFGSQGWPAFSRRFTLASVLLVAGLWLSAAIHVWTEARLTPPEGEPAGPEAASLQARMITILPIIRFGAISLVLLVVALMALSILGIDITPLMAGAGILGLAISLGSQTLVKDIVSGLFYMLDDVFRLGETIESAGRQGRLETISTRSVRLRDADGRVHTIPFGELGTVTNHSRRLVQVELAITFGEAPGRARLAGLARALGAALRSEPLLQTGIVGAITTLPGDDRLEARFVIDAGRAGPACRLAPKLVAGELADAGFAPEAAIIRARSVEMGAARAEPAPNLP